MKKTIINVRRLVIIRKWAGVPYCQVILNLEMYVFLFKCKYVSCWIFYVKPLDPKLPFTYIYVLHTKVKFDLIKIDYFCQVYALITNRETNH